MAGCPRRRRGRLGGCAVLAVVVLLAGRAGRAETQTQWQPALIVGGGYDDNLLFNGLGGDGIGQTGFRVDLKAWERTYTLSLDAGIFAYGFLENRRIVPLGDSTLNYTSELSRLDTVRVRVRARGSDDPLGLAQLGVFDAQGSVIGYRSSAEYEHAFDERTSLASLVTFDGVGFLTAPYTSRTGEAAGVGLEPRYRLTRDLTLDFTAQERNFFSSGLEGIALDGLPGARYRIMRHLFAQADLGPTAFLEGTRATPIAVGHGFVEYDDHTWGARLTVSQDLAVPTERAGVLLVQLAEGAVSYSDNAWEVRLRGGYYRDLGSLSSNDWEPGVGGELEAYRKLGDFTWVGFTATRFQQIQTPTQPAMSQDAIYAQIELTKGRP